MDAPHLEAAKEHLIAGRALGDTAQGNAEQHKMTEQLLMACEEFVLHIQQLTGLLVEMQGVSNLLGGAK